MANKSQKAKGADCRTKRSAGSQQRRVMPHRVKTQLTRELKMCERISDTAKTGKRWRLKEYTDGYMAGIKYAASKIYAA